MENGNDPRLQVNLANARLGLGDLETATTLYARASEMDANLAAAFFNTARLHYRKAQTLFDANEAAELEKEFARKYPARSLQVIGIQVAAEGDPLAAAKAYRELQREGFIETLRGEGLIVREGVHAGLMKRERARFIKEEWPHLRARLARMELDLKALFSSASD